MLNSVIELRSTTGAKANRKKDWEMTEGDVFYVLRDLIKQTKEEVWAFSFTSLPFLFNSYT